MCKTREEEFVGSHVLLFLAAQCLREGTQMFLLWMQIGSAAEIVPWYHCRGFTAAAPSCRVDSSLSDISRGGPLPLTEKRLSLSTSCPYSDCHWPWFFSCVNEDWPVFSFGRGLIFKAQRERPLCFAWFSLVNCVMYLHGLLHSLHCLIEWKLPEVQFVLCAI